MKGFIKKDLELLKLLKPYKLKARQIDLIIILLSFNTKSRNYKLKTLSKLLDVSWSTIQRYIKDLSNKKLIKVIRKRRYLQLICLLNYDIKNSTLSLRDYKPKQIREKQPPTTAQETYDNMWSDYKKPSAEDWYKSYLEQARKEEENKHKNNT